MKIKSEDKIRKIADDIRKSGGRAYLVGGSVRDMVNRVQSEDVDVEVFGMEPDKLKEILSRYGKVIFAGRSFGVYKLENIDFSLPKNENKPETDDSDFYVTPQPDCDVKEAARRRDLTMNSIFRDILEEKIIDPYGGLEDIKKKIIRHTDARSFKEDPLRVLRVAQFSARFEYEVAEETSELCKTLVDELVNLPRERVFAELEKLLMKARRPSIGFIWLKGIGALKKLFPELDVLSEVKQDDRHPEGDVFAHTMLSLNVLSIPERTLPVMFAILLHDTGKVTTGSYMNGEIHFYGHARESVGISEKVLRRITSDAKLIEEGLLLIKYHTFPLDLRKEPIEKKQIRRLALKVDVPALLKVHRADKLGRGKPKNIKNIDTVLKVYEEIKNEIKPLVMGRHLVELGMKPSPEFGNILKEIFDAQLNEEFFSVEEGIEFTKKLLKRRKKPHHS